MVIFLFKNIFVSSNIPLFKFVGMVYSNESKSDNIKCYGFCKFKDCFIDIIHYNDINGIICLNMFSQGLGSPNLHICFQRTPVSCQRITFFLLHFGTLLRMHARHTMTPERRSMRLNVSESCFGLCPCLGPGFALARA